MSSIGEHADASASEEEWGRFRDGERVSPLSGVVVAFADLVTRPVSARSSAMTAAEALLEYASGGWTDNSRAN